MPAAESQDHHVWAFYDFRKTVRLNWKHYQQQLRRTRRVSNAFEILLAVTAPGSAVAGFAFWEQPWGRTVWMLLGGLAAVFSLVRPILKLGKKVERLAKATQEYAALDGDCEALSADIRYRKRYDDRHFAQFQALLKRRNTAKAEMADEVVSTKSVLMLQEAVDREFPAEQFFIPKEAPDDRAQE